MSKDVDLDDDFGLDDLDFDSFGLDAPPPKDDRNPAMNTAVQFKDDLIDDLSDPDNIRRMTRDALPDGYKMAWEGVDNIATTGRDLYDSATKELAPMVQETKQITRKLAPRLRSIMPDGVVDKIEGWANKEDGGSARVEQDADEAAISSSINNIFMAQAQHSDEQNREEFVEKTADKMVQTERYKNTSEQINAIIERLDKGVSYQDQVLSKYQRTSLELQYRQYFAARDLLEHTKLTNANWTQLFQNIVKNTGLPDYQKSLLSEDWKAMAQEKLLGKAHEPIGDQLQNWSAGWVENMRSDVMEKVTEFGGMGTMIMQQVNNMVKDPNDNQNDMMMQGGGNPISGLVAGIVGDQLRKRAARKGRSYLEQNNQVMAGANIAEALFGNVPQFMNELSDTNAEDLGIESKSGKAAFNALKWFTRYNPSMGVNEEVLHNLKDEATTPVPWDMMQRRSIIEIIPGYLSRQLQQLEILATGDRNIDRLVYSTDREEFVGSQVAANDAVNNIFNDKSLAAFGENLVNAIDRIDQDKTLSDKARNSLQQHLQKDAKAGRTFNPYRYIKDEEFADFGNETAQELGAFFRRQMDMSEGDTGPNLKSQLVTGRIKRLINATNEAAGAMNDYQTGVNRYMGTGEKDILRQAGIIHKTEGSLTDSIDFQNMNARQNNAFLRAQEKMRAEERGDSVAGPEMSFSMQQQRRDALRSGYRQPAMDTRPVTQVEASPQFANFNLPTTFPLPIEQLDMLRDPLNALAEQEKNKDTTFEDMNSVMHQSQVTLTEILEEIRTGAVGGEGGTRINVNTGTWLPSMGKMARGGLGKITKGIGWANRKSMGMLKMPFKLAKRLTDTVTEGIGRGLGLVSDVYVNGRDKAPALLKEKLKLGHYRLQEDGTVVRTLKDITGPVVDENGNVVISLEDFQKGFHDSKGKELILEGAKWIIAAPFKAAQMLFPTPFRILGNMRRWTGNRLNEMRSFVNRTKDIYVKGDDTPALYAHKLTAGEYFLQSDLSKAIRTVEDITGPVVDQEGNVVLSLQDIQKGLVDSQGNEIRVRSLTGAALGLIGKGIGKVGALGKGIFKRMKGIHDAVFNTIGDVLGIVRGNISKMAARANGMEFGQMDIFAKTVNVYLDEGGAITRKVAGDHSDDVSDAPQSSAYKEMKDDLNKVKQRASERSTKLKQKFQDIKAELDEKISPAVKEQMEKTTGRSWEDLKRELSEDNLRAMVDEQRDLNDVRVDVVKDVLSTTGKNLKSRLLNLIPGRWRKNLSDKKTQLLLEKERISEEISDAAKAQIMQATGQSWETIKQQLSAENLEALRKQAEESGDDFDPTQYRLDFLQGLTTKAQGKLGAFKESLFDRFKMKRDEESSEEDNTTALEKLTRVIKEHMPKPKSVSGDSDGDGLRDNSWMAQLRKKKEAKAEDTDKDDSAPEKEEKSSGFGLGGIITALLGLKTFLGQKFDGLLEIGKGVLETIAKGRMLDKGLDVAGDMMDGPDGKRTKGGKGGKLLKGAKAVGKFALGALTSVGGWAVRGAMAAASAAGAVVSAPVVAIAAGAAAAGTAGYYGYKYMSRRAEVEPLEKLRYFQYGLNPEDQAQLVAIRYFEDNIMDEVRYNRVSVPEIVADPLTLFEEYADDFGANPEDPVHAQAWVTWFNSRFKPVFLTNLAHARRMQPKDNLDLLDIDDEMDPTLKVDFAKRTVYQPGKDYNGPNPYSIWQSPFGETPIEVGYARINNQVNAIIRQFGSLAQKGQMSHDLPTPEPIETATPNTYANMASFNEANRKLLAETKKTVTQQATTVDQVASAKQSGDVTNLVKAQRLGQDLAVNGAKVGINNKPIASTTEKKTRFADAKEFANYMLPYAERAAKSLGVDPVMLIAQAAQETGWGKKISSENGVSSNNLFNIKADKSWRGPAVMTKTHEYYNGRKTYEYAPFRAYDSYQDSFNDYVNFLWSNPRYGNALSMAGDSMAFAWGLQDAGYATDPNYANNLLAVARSVRKRLTRQPTATPEETPETETPAAQTTEMLSEPKAQAQADAALREPKAEPTPPATPAILTDPKPGVERTTSVIQQRELSQEKKDILRKQADDLEADISQGRFSGMRLRAEKKRLKSLRRLAGQDEDTQVVASAGEQTRAASQQVTQTRVEQSAQQLADTQAKGLQSRLARRQANAEQTSVKPMGPAVNYQAPEQPVTVTQSLYTPQARVMPGSYREQPQVNVQADLQLEKARQITQAQVAAQQEQGVREAQDMGEMKQVQKESLSANQDTATTLREMFEWMKSNSGSGSMFASGGPTAATPTPTPPTETKSAPPRFNPTLTHQQQARQQTRPIPLDLSK